MCPCNDHILGCCTTLGCLIWDRSELLFGMSKNTKEFGLKLREYQGAWDQLRPPITRSSSSRNATEAAAARFFLRPSSSKVHELVNGSKTSQDFSSTFLEFFPPMTKRRPARPATAGWARGQCISGSEIQTFSPMFTNKKVKSILRKTWYLYTMFENYQNVSFRERLLFSFHTQKKPQKK